ncbi:hypothetical protein Y1Q_0016043 [Alligator mississippiensis]|uniref:Uncharacterized protein n=1 Tax=Alligator mississippiensis TaxID=8496 RepID=A0A151MVX5_ALLMI|nr:hypothetical protein Y1Q_0016043 [Alligator mississippiensis]
MIPCTSDEDQCIEFTGILVAGNVTLLKSAFGCGSPGICDKRFGVTKYIKNTFDILTDVACYPAPHHT